MGKCLEIGEMAFEFSLIGADGMIHTLNQHRGSRAIVVMFLGNDCPYVIDCEEYLCELAEKYRQRGVVFVAINSNNCTVSQNDTYENMVARMEAKEFPWKYLHDSTQQTASRYGATTTPHFFLLDNNRYLIYKGKALENPADSSSTDFLKAALDEYLNSSPISMPRTEAIGSEIAWSENRYELAGKR